MDTFSKDIAKILTDAREEQGISQQEMAEYIGINYRILDKIEIGSIPMDLNYFNKYCERLGDKGIELLLPTLKRKNIMNAKDYQKLAMRTNDRKGTDRLSKFIGKCITNYTNDSIKSYYDVGGLLNGVLGLAGESGEFADMIKKWIFHEKELDELHAKKELGDVLWYVAMICESFDWSMEEIMGLNIDKLMTRYPEGFDIERANNRKEGDV